ncbi:TRAP dicarboxylate transporter, DctQ subunit, unknown substrate 6 [hydrothermal vent metagenome]|uniref:Tripartite ATP-independent periplasmic transporters DctQ component domain-containing protein n=1 Tax=hydrothermal vent metagenome TaxID=652676 RepID=A0A3B0XLD3_9ZZZZ
MLQIAEQLEQLIDRMGQLTAWLVSAMVLITTFVVLLRYLFDMGWIALQESVSYLHSIVFLLGASYTLKYNEHVRVDIFYERLSETGKAWVDLAGHLFILMPVMVFVFWVSWPYVMDSWQVSESSREAGGLPGVYLLKSLILLMAMLLMVQGVALILKAIVKITGSSAP